MTDDLPDGTAPGDAPGPDTPPEAGESPDPRHQMVAVGIGASAGGLEALRTLMPNLALDSNIAYIVAQHLDPKHRSLLATLLDRNTQLSVIEAENGQRLKPGVIYVCPANKDVTIADKCIHLRQPRHHIGPKPSVDLFLTSLAEDFGEQAVGVILSGTGSDGAHGIRAIKAAGGITIAQDQATAKYNGMPVAAVDTGAVDFILPPEAIARELALITQVYPRKLVTASPSSQETSSYARIMSLIKKRTECDFSDYKENTILRRINRRMVAQRVETIEDYEQFLEKSGTEVDLLCKDILISVTSFFRDDEAFQALDETIKDIVEHKKPGDPIRIWVPGCATGEEVYSLAILLSERLQSRVSEHNIQIFGTDLDTTATLTGRKGLYSEAALENLDDRLINRYFQRVGSGYQVNKSLREMTIFARQDLVRDPPFLRIDMVSCRNLLIYFNAELQRRIFELFHYILNPRGYLFLGKSESIGDQTDLFEPVNRKWRIFRRKQTLRTPLIDIANRSVRLPGTPPRRERDPTATLESRMHEVLNGLYAPPGVVVNERMDIERIHGDVSPFLRFPQGQAGLNLLSLAREELRLSLRALLHKTFRDKMPTASQGLQFGDDGATRMVRIQVQPFVIDNDVGGQFALVCFESPQEMHPGVAADVDTESATQQRVNDLEQELAAAREHVQTVVEEIETSNEELQSLNEELQASNEELQSSNQELETSNEELQSTNEELITVNEELQVKSSELAAANQDLENILNTVGLGLVVVDRDLRVRRFSPLASRIFGMMPGELGQIITAVPTHIDIGNLRGMLFEVMETGKVFQREVVTHTVTYWMKIYPYVDEQKTIDGAILTFLDKTDLHDAILRLRDQEDRSAVVRRLAGLAVWEWDLAGGRMAWSPEVCALFGIKPGAFAGTFQAYLDLVHDDDQDRVAREIQSHLESDDRFQVDHRVVWPDETRHWLRLNAKVERDDDGRAQRVIGLAEAGDAARHLAVGRRERQLVLDLLPVPAMITDRQGTVLAANDALTHRLDRSDIAGRLCSEAVGCGACADSNPQAGCPIANPGHYAFTATGVPVTFESPLGPVRVYPVLDEDRMFDRFLVTLTGAADDGTAEKCRVPS